MRLLAAEKIVSLERMSIFLLFPSSDNRRRAGDSHNKEYNWGFIRWRRDDRHDREPFRLFKRNMFTPQSVVD